MSDLKVAIIYDWIDTSYGGAEKVIRALSEAFPDAPIYTSIALFSQASWAANLNIRPSFLQQVPFISRFPRKLLPFFPLAFESLVLDDFDVVISVTSAQAKGVLTRPGQLHICYLLTPPRYLYSHEAAYTQASTSIVPLRWLARLVFAYVRWWDQSAALRPDVTIPISKLVARRYQLYYGRTAADVIYPPVEMEGSNKPEIKVTQLPYPLPPKFALIVSRLVRYKEIDIAIQACIAQKQHLIIIGEGEEKARLESIAGESEFIHFWGAQSQIIVEAVRRQCQVVLMPALEDFGLAAAEAVAAGKLVIVHEQSGVAELLVDGETGVFIPETTVAELRVALEKAKQLKPKADQLQQSMRKYATTTFVETIRQLVHTRWQALQRERQYESK